MSISLWGWSEFQLRRISLLIVAKGYLLSAAKAHYREAVFISWMCFCFGISHASITLRQERTWFVAAPGKSSYGVWISWQVDPGLFLITNGFWVLSAALLFFIGIASCIRINTLIRNPELEVDRYFG